MSLQDSVSLTEDAVAEYGDGNDAFAELVSRAVAQDPNLENSASVSASRRAAAGVVGRTSLSGLQPHQSLLQHFWLCRPKYGCCQRLEQARVAAAAGGAGYGRSLSMHYFESEARGWKAFHKRD